MQNKVMSLYASKPYLTVVLICYGFAWLLLLLWCAFLFFVSYQLSLNENAVVKIICIALGIFWSFDLWSDAKSIFEVGRILALSGTPIFSFKEHSVLCRSLDGISITEVPYAGITKLAVVHDKQNGMHLRIFQLNNEKTDVRFDHSNLQRKEIMEEFMKFRPDLQPRYGWDWDNVSKAHA